MAKKPGKRSGVELNLEQIWLTVEGLGLAEEEMLFDSGTELWLENEEENLAKLEAISNLRAWLWAAAKAIERSEG